MVILYYENETSSHQLYDSGNDLQVLYTAMESNIREHSCDFFFVLLIQRYEVVCIRTGRTWIIITRVKRLRKTLFITQWEVPFSLWRWIIYYIIYNEMHNNIFIYLPTYITITILLLVFFFIKFITRESRVSTNYQKIILIKKSKNLKNIILMLYAWYIFLTF